MERILAQLFGLTFDNTPSSIKSELKDLKLGYLSLIVNSLTKIQKFFEKISDDKSLCSKLESSIFIANVKSQLQMSLTMTESSLNNTMEMIANMAKSFTVSKNLDKLNPILEETGLSVKSELSKRSFEEMTEDGISETFEIEKISKERKINLKDPLPLKIDPVVQAQEEKEQKRRVAKGRQKENKNDQIVNSQTFARPKKRVKVNNTQPKPEQSQKTTTMTMVMNSQIDQTVPDSDTSSDEDDKMQVSTLKITQKDGKNEKKFKKPPPMMDPSKMLFSQIPQLDALDDSDSSDDEDSGAMKEEKKKADSTPSFKIPKLNVIKKKIEEDKKKIQAKPANFNKFSLMSQLPQNDVLSSSSDEDDSGKMVEEKKKPVKKLTKKVAKKKITTTKKVRKTRGSKKKKEIEISDEDEEDTSPNENIILKNFKIVSPTSKLDTQYISALVVKNNDNSIVAGRWFGIWNLEKTDDKKQFECSKRLVNQCKENVVNDE